MRCRSLDRIKALLAELQQAVADFEHESAAKPRRRPVVKVETQADPKVIADVKRRLRRGGFAA